MVMKWYKSICIYRVFAKVLKFLNRIVNLDECTKLAYPYQIEFIRLRKKNKK